MEQSHVTTEHTKERPGSALADFQPHESAWADTQDTKDSQQDPLVQLRQECDTEFRLSDEPGPDGYFPGLRHTSDVKNDFERYPDDKKPSNHASAVRHLENGQTNGKHPEAKTLLSKPPLEQKGIRDGYVRSSSSALAIFIIVVIAYALLFHFYDIRSGFATILDASCQTVTAVNIVVHLLLNAASTVLLSSATFSMQTLCAPTRQDVDTAHHRRRWLDIGLQSRRNLAVAGHMRRFLWVLLGASSIFIHLTFNAVFYTASQTNQYAVALVSSDYLATPSTATCNTTNPDQYLGSGYIEDSLSHFANRTGCPISSLLNTYSDNASALMELSPADCIRRYGPTLITGSASLILVGDNVTEDLAWARWPERYLYEDTNVWVNEWVCHDFIPNQILTRCTTERALQQLAVAGWTVHGQTVRQCRVQPMYNTCQLKFNVWFMLAVVVFSFFNTLAIIVTALLYWRSPLLHTVGDTIASFLHTPDACSDGMSMANHHDFQAYSQAGIKPGPKYPPSHRMRRYEALSTWRWWGTHTVHLIFIAGLAVALYFANQGARGTGFSNGIGTPDLQSLEPVTHSEAGSTEFIPTMLVVNVLQLAYTLVGFCITGMLKNICLTREWFRYAIQRKGLRMGSKPQGRQRSAYFLSMPLRLSLPMMAFSTTVHWLLSQSLFLVQVESKDISGNLVPSDTITRVGYSVLAVCLTIIVLVIQQALLLFYGLRKLPNVGIPTFECHTMAIAAACHPVDDDDELYLRELQWGDVSRPLSEDRDGRIRQCAFSANPVLRPAPKSLYM